MHPYISVVIPVYNGTKFIQKTVRCILSQTMTNIEVILVENGSSDGSLAMCQSIAQKEPRVRAYHSDEKGTFLARKMGIELAVGEYIVFCDQDDTYATKQALQRMYDAITQDRVQICQFGKIHSYYCGIRRRIRITAQKQIILRDSNYADTVRGAAGVPGGAFDTVVWTKIYEASILKNAVKNVTQTLRYAEDVNLNMHAFFDPGVERVSVRAEEYYVWNVGVGFSANQKNLQTLFREYSVVKTTALKLLQENGCSGSTLHDSHLETVFYLREYAHSMLESHEPHEEILAHLNEMKEYPHVLLAKQYFNALPDGELYDELRFLISDYTAEEFLQWCIENKPKKSFKKRIWKMLKLIRHV